MSDKKTDIVIPQHSEINDRSVDDFERTSVVAEGMNIVTGQPEPTCPNLA